MGGSHISEGVAFLEQLLDVIASSLQRSAKEPRSRADPLHLHAGSLPYDLHICLKHAQSALVALAMRPRFCGILDGLVLYTKVLHGHFKSMHEQLAAVPLLPPSAAADSALGSLMLTWYQGLCSIIMHAAPSKERHLPLALVLGEAVAPVIEALPMWLRLCSDKARHSSSPTFLRQSEMLVPQASQAETLCITAVSLVRACIRVSLSASPRNNAVLTEAPLFWGGGPSQWSALKRRSLPDHYSPPAELSRPSAPFSDEEKLNDVLQSLVEADKEESTFWSNLLSATVLSVPVSACPLLPWHCTQ